MNLPIKLPPRPTPLPAEISRSLSLRLSGIEEIGFQKYRFNDPGKALSPEFRQVLDARLQALDVWLAPASRRVIDAEITTIFAQMAMKDVTEDDRLKEHVLWRNDLLRASLSTFALTEACARFRLGDAGDCKGKFAPKVGEIVQEARAIERAYRQERSKIKTALIAEVPKPPPSGEDRAAAVARYERVIKPVLQAARPRNEVMRGFAAEVVEPVPRKTPEEELADLRERRAAEGPVQVSDSLKALLARQMAHAKQGDTGGME